MEREEDVRMPLMGGLKMEKLKGFTDHGLNSVSHMRDYFFQNLPDKVKSGVDPEHLVNIDLSGAKGLIQ
ncbi:unnamed protein product, partial [Ilex paraguariensis]